MMSYIGIDAHSKTCTAVVMNETGKITCSSCFATSESNLIGFVRSVPKPRKVAFEEQGLAQWIYLTLAREVDEIVVCNAVHLPKQRGAKGDYVDAVRIVDDLRVNRLAPVFHDSGPLWDMRTIVSSYRDFTQDLVRSKLRYKSMLRDRGIPCSGTTIYSAKEIPDELAGDAERFAAQRLLSTIRFQQDSKDAYEAKFKQLSKRWPVIRKLCSIPGISHVRASTIAAIICSAERFPNKHKLWAYSKLVRYHDKSDGHIYASRSPKGRPELKEVFIGAATAVLKGGSALRRYYDQLRTSGLSHEEAKLMVARRIAAVALMVMKTGKSYDDLYEERRRRERLHKS
jgi:transposase